MKISRISNSLRYPSQFGILIAGRRAQFLLFVDYVPAELDEYVVDSCKVSFLRGPLCQVGGVGQDMKQTYLYQWYPLLQEQWDRCDEQNHQT
jgi:hypothetical protein